VWWPGWILRSISRLHGNRSLRLRLVGSPKLAGGRGLSTTSVAVVYAVMLELGFNTTEFGKAILAACFINDLGTVIALGLIFSPLPLERWRLSLLRWWCLWVFRF